MSEITLRFLWTIYYCNTHNPYLLVYSISGMTKDIPDSSSVSIQNATVLLNLGDSVTTDHISPAGSIARSSSAARYSQAFFGHFEKNSSKFSKNLSKSFKNSIICRLKTDFFAQKSPEVDIFCTKICPNKVFSTKQSLKLGKFRKFWEKIPFF